MFAHFTKMSHTIWCEGLSDIVLALVLAPIENRKMDGIAFAFLLTVTTLG
jgi:hypothetical protein